MPTKAKQSEYVAKLRDAGYSVGVREGYVSLLYDVALPNGKKLASGIGPSILRAFWLCHLRGHTMGINYANGADNA